MTSLIGQLAAGTWTCDVRASSARFRARDVLHKPVDGTLPVLSASVQVSPEGSPLQVQAELDLAGVDTGSTRRDHDLRGRRFFDAEHDRMLRFTAGAARADGPGRWLVDGELALRGHRCPLQLTAELVLVAGGRGRVRASATLDRRDVGITVPRLLVGRWVDVEVEAVLVPPAPGGRP